MKRIFAGIFAGLLIGLAGCGTGGSSSSSQASSASPAPSEESSQEASQPSSEGELTEVPPFNGLDPAASLSNEELAATIQAAYEGTGEFAQIFSVLLLSSDIEFLFRYVIIFVEIDYNKTGSRGD